MRYAHHGRQAVRPVARLVPRGEDRRDRRIVERPGIRNLATGAEQLLVAAPHDVPAWQPRSSPQPQSVHFPAIDDHVCGDPPVTFDGSADSGLEVTYTTDGPCRLNDSGKVRLTGAGDCTVTAHQDGDADWQAAEPVSRTFHIAKAPLTVTADDATKVLGAPNPDLTAGFDGFVNGEGPDALGGTLTCTTTAMTSSPVGTYPITCSGLTSPDYRVSYVDGTLSVTFAPPGPGPSGPGHLVLQPVNANGTSVFKAGSTVPGQVPGLRRERRLRRDPWEDHPVPPHQDHRRSLMPGGLTVLATRRAGGGRVSVPARVRQPAAPPARCGRTPVP